MARARKGPRMTLDVSVIQRTLDALDGEEARIMLYRALQKGGKKLRSMATDKMLSKSWKFNPKQKEYGVKMKGDPSECELVVFPATFLGLHWLELGTKPRQLKKDHPQDSSHRRTLKKGESRGSIKAEPFFLKLTTDSSIGEAIEEELGKQFDKAVKKYN